MSDNEIIAEFMGGVFNTDSSNPGKWWFYPQPTKHYRKDAMHLTVGLKYDTEWDWLMPVVEKISQLHSNNFKYDMDKIRDGEWPKDDQYMAVIALPMATPITEAHKAVIEFIHWYNQQKQ